MHVEFSHSMVQAGDVSLHVVEAGQGQEVLFLHGWPSTWLEWRTVMASLATDYRVIAIDLRGMGDSEKPLYPYDANTIAIDIERLLNALGVQSAHVVAHDLGGPPAYVFASRNPVRTRSLAFFEAPFFGIVGDGVPDLTSMFWHFKFHAQVDLAVGLLSGRERTYLEYFFRCFSYNKTAFEREVVDEYVRCYSAPGGLRGGLEHYRSISKNAEICASLAKTPLELPVLAFGGETVLCSYVYDAAQLVARSVKGGVVPRCGHWIPEERPDFVVEELRRHFWSC